ncbi:MAG: glycosyltransferase family 4 protein [Syntrophobacteraceae bacterium]
MSEKMHPYRLAILDSHVIQYFAPLYRRLAEEPDIDLTVYYCSRQGLDAYNDPGFGGQRVQWDVPLLGGYKAVFLKNLRCGGATGGFWRLVNPDIIGELRHYRYDALWVHGLNCATHLLAYVIARCLGTAIFTRGDTNVVSERSRRGRLLHDLLLRRLYDQCDACLAVGTRNAEFYRYLGVPDAKIFLAPFAVDNERFIAGADACRPSILALKQKLGLRQGLPVLLFASKFIRRKNAMHLLRAKAALQSEGIECAVLLIGAGEEEDGLRRYSSDKKLRDVHFLGFRNQSELPKYFVLSDIFVLPAENEPWGLVVNEVMCAGVAIVATEEIGAVADLVRQGENGMLYPTGNIDSLTSILRRLIRDPALCERMGWRSREIISKWGYEQCVAGVKEALHSTKANRLRNGRVDTRRTASLCSHDTRGRE